jgi:hypothetical protein
MGIIKIEVLFDRSDLQSLGIDSKLHFDAIGQIWLDLAGAEPVLKQVQKVNKTKIVLSRGAKRLGKEVTSTEALDPVENRILNMSASEWTLKTKLAYEAYIKIHSAEKDEWGFPQNPNALVSTSDGVNFLKKFLLGQVVVPQLAPTKVGVTPPPKEVETKTPSGVPLLTAPVTTGAPSLSNRQAPVSTRGNPA